MELLHPAIVHFPIAFYLLETYLLVLAVKKNKTSYVEFASLVFKLGYGFMWLALGSGLYAAGGLPKALQHARFHFAAALSVMFYSTLRLALWRSRFASNPKVLLISGIFLSLLVLITGFFGGKLVYD